jgi:hypothetical protein
MQFKAVIFQEEDHKLTDIENEDEKEELRSI